MESSDEFKGGYRRHCCLVSGRDGAIESVKRRRGSAPDEAVRIFLIRGGRGTVFQGAIGIIPGAALRLKGERSGA
ncbi:hypothetical protein [Fodinibius sediminis]|uniref:hypothetical protein n=1 Tax=Fodinibius sediminis TaxID=1214077 RepID=UPI001157C746|nr:hypothetical protein [Fodinibius sediminis]